MFTYTLAPYSGATFTWAGTQSGGYQFPAALQLQASSFNSTAGLETETTTDTQGGYDVGYADNGDYAVYQNVNFGAGFTNVSVREASFGGGTLELRLDSLTGPIISSFALTSTGGWQTWQTLHEPVSGASGLHDLYAIFRGGPGGLGNLNWLQFSGALPPATYQQWQLLYFGCTNCPQAQAGADPLGKGISNTNQFLLGLNPTNPASVFRFITVTPRGTNVIVTWKTAGVRTNVVQARAGGDYATNGFADISGPIIINVSGDSITNFTDIGGATNFPARYYRVRLMP
jgi:hypothetical protein